MRLLCLVLAPALSPAYGQTYPSKPVRVIVAFSAGGGTDIIARTAGGSLGAVW